MSQEKLTASSCAVENHPDGGIRLTLSFINFDEYNRAHDQFRGHALFTIDRGDPRSGGSIGGSKLVVYFTAAAIGDLPQMETRRPAEFVNGERTPCASVADAILMAGTHP